MDNMHIVEYWGSGIKAMAGSLRDANREPPGFDDRRRSFLVTFRNHTLMNPEAVRWLSQFAARALNDRQRLALVYLREHDRLANAEYRRLNRVDPLVAGQELRGLVDAGLVEQDGVGRWTTYRLKVAHELPEQVRPVTDEDKVLAYVREKGSITNRECQEVLGSTAVRACHPPEKLADAHRLAPKGAAKGRKRAAPHELRRYPDLSRKLLRLSRGNRARLKACGRQLGGRASWRATARRGGGLAARLAGRLALPRTGGPNPTKHGRAAEAAGKRSTFHHPSLAFPGYVPVPPASLLQCQIVPGESRIRSGGRTGKELCRVIKKVRRGGAARGVKSPTAPMANGRSEVRGWRFAEKTL